MSCGNLSDINQTFIVEPVTSEAVISGCSGIYTNILSSCSGDTSILLGTGSILFNGDIVGGAISGSSIFGDFISGASISGDFISGTFISGTSISGNNISGDIISGTTISGDTFYGDGSNLTGIYTAFRPDVGQFSLVSIQDDVNYPNIASGNFSFAIGQGTDAIGFASYAEGGFTTAIGDASHAQGYQTLASGLTSHAGGWASQALGDYSFVHGFNSFANATNSIVLGANLIGDANDTTYVDRLNINTPVSGVPITNLGLDIDGNVVIGMEVIVAVEITGNTIVFTNSTGGTTTAYGLVNTATTLNINGNSYDLSTNREWVVAQGSTGVLEYAGAFVHSSTTINVGAVKGYIIDNETNPLIPSFTYLDFSGETGATVTSIGGGTGSYVLLKSDNTLLFQNTYPTSQERKENILLSKVGHPNGIVTFVINEPDFILSPVSQLRDLFKSIKYINDGVYAYPTGNNLKFNITSGFIFGNGVNFVVDDENPNQITVGPFTSGTSFVYRTLTGGTSSLVTDITPNFYDLNGVITPVPTTASTIQWIFNVPSAGFAVQYGQTLYSSLIEAVINVGKEDFTVFSNLIENAILIGVLAVTSTASTLTATTQAKFFRADKFGQIAGSQAGVSTSTLQNAYDNSTSPQITITPAGGALQIKSIDSSSSVLQGLDTANTITFNIDGSGNFTASTISATTYFNLPLDDNITGGTYASGTTTFTNNSGGTFDISGYTYIPHLEYVNANRTLWNNGFGNDITNLSFGEQALISIATTANTYNVALGYKVLSGNTTGKFNVGIGAEVLTNNLTGDYNFGLGASAMNANINGTQNLALGSFALAFSSGGSRNTAVGVAALQNGTSPSRNVGIGNFALYINNGDRNVAIGNFAGSNSVGANNTLIGADTPSAPTGLNVGDNNTFIGKLITGILTGSNNTLIGKVTGLSATTNNNTIIANGAGFVTFKDDNVSTYIPRLAGATTRIVTVGVGGLLTATPISAAGFTDVFVTGGTFIPSASTITFRNNSGGTFNVSGISSSATFTGGTVTGATYFSNGLSANTISATTYLGLPTDIRVTGGTFTGSTAVFTNNTGGTFIVSGFVTNDTYVTGGTMSGNTAIFRNNTGGTFNINGIVNTATTLNINGNSYNLNANREWVVAQGSTGVLTYAGAFVHSSTTINVGAVKGYVIDNETNPLIPNFTYLDFSGQTGITVTTIGGGTGSYVLLTSANTITFQNTYPTSQERKENILLSKVGHPSGTVTFVINEPDFILSPISQLRDLFKSIKYINDGVFAYPNTGLSFNISGGFVFGNGVNFVVDDENPNQIAVGPFTSGTSFVYRTQTGGTTGLVTAITPSFYDVGGVITPVPSTASTIQWLFNVPSAGFALQFGQTLYPSLNEAISNIGKEDFTVFSNLVENAILIGVLAVTSTATTLSATSQARFFRADKFGQIVGSQAGVSTATLQSAYDNSMQPQITIGPTGALQLKVNTSNTPILQGLNVSNTVGLNVNGDGAMTATSIFGTTSVTSPIISATTYLNLPISSGGSGTFTGGTVSGATIFTNGITANTFNIQTITAGENLVYGNLVYLSNDGKYYKASNLTASTSSTELRLALDTILTNTSGLSLIDGEFTTIGLTAGARYIIGTGGTITTEQPTTDYSIVRYVGTALSTTKLEFNSDETYIELINFTGDTGSGSSTFNGGTVTGPTIFTASISAATYLGLPTDIRVTGGTVAGGIATFRNNTGGTFTVTGIGSGIFTGGTITGPTLFTAGASANTISANTITVRNISATTISATTYQNLPFWTTGTGQEAVVRITVFGPNIATAANSIALGYNSSATSQVAFSEGHATLASGSESHAEGLQTQANGDQSHSEGYDTRANGNDGSHAEGRETRALGNSSHAEGYRTSATTSAAHAEGQQTRAAGGSSHAEGLQTTATGSQSHAEGYNTTASGNNGSHAEGNSSVAAGEGSHAENTSTANGYYSHSEGAATTAQGNYSHAQNLNCLAQGDYSHAGGNSSSANGDSAFVHANTSILNGNFSAILGGANITGDAHYTTYVPDFVITKNAATPTSAGDTIGEVGSITWDDNYFYVKTINGWGRLLLDFSW